MLPGAGIPRLGLPSLGRRGTWLRLLAALALGAAGGAGWLWFRDSSFVAVRQVRISGLSGPQARAIDGALRRSAERMSTLDYSPAALRAALAAYPQVAGISVRGGFPHTLNIVVHEQLPVAMLRASDGARSAIAADGALLGQALTGGSLPVIDVSALPHGRLVAGAQLEMAQVIGAMPGALGAFVLRAQESPRGIMVDLRGGQAIYFGAAAHARAKWLAAARALLALPLTEVQYVDVSVPGRPAIGVAGAAAAQQAGTGAASNEAVLVKGLEAAIGGHEETQPATASAQGLAAGASQQAGTGGGESPSAEAAATAQAAGGAGNGAPAEGAGGAPGSGAAGAAESSSAGSAEATQGSTPGG